MSYTDPSTDIEAQMTDQARTLIARAALGDVVFQVVGFGLGRGGYVPSNFVQVTPLDTGANELDDKVYPTSTPYDYAVFAQVETPSPTVYVYNCRVEASNIAGNADYALGEVGLYGQIVKSNIPAEVGSYFLYALSHFPALCKTRRDVLLRRVIISY